MPKLKAVWILPIVAVCAATWSYRTVFVHPTPKIDDDKARIAGFASGDEAMDTIHWSNDSAPLNSEADFARLTSLAHNPGYAAPALAVSAIGRAPDDATRRRALGIVSPLLAEPSLHGIAETAFHKWADAGGLPLLKEIAREGDPNVSPIAQSVVTRRTGQKPVIKGSPSKTDPARRSAAERAGFIN